MIVYDVILDGEVREKITPTYADLVSLYHIMKDYWLPIMTKKYGQAVQLVRREEASEETKRQVAQAFADCERRKAQS